MSFKSLNKVNDVWSTLSELNLNNSECKELIFMLCIRVGTGTDIANVICSLIDVITKPKEK